MSPADAKWLDNERRLLGGLLIEPARVEDVRKFVQPEHIQDPQLRAIFMEVERRHDAGEPTDPVSVREALAPRIEGSATLFAALMGAVAGTAHLPHYAEVVAENGRRHQGRVAALRLAKDLEQAPTGTIGECLEKFEGELARLRMGAVNRRKRKPLLRAFSDIQRRHMEWLWPGRIPAGKLVLLAGEPGGGKSTLTLDMAARISGGEPWPDGATCERGAVLLLSAEDDPEDTTGPRLDAAGADDRLVLELSTVEALGRGGRIEQVPAGLADLAELADKLREGVRLPCGQVVPYRLVVIDPLTAYLAGTDTHRNSEVRVALRPLADLAAQAGVTILTVLHPRKGTSGNPLDLISGSRAYVEAARAAWLVTPDPDDEEGRLRLLLPLKGNVLPPDTSGLRFGIEADPETGAVAVRWHEGPVDARVRDVLAAYGQDSEERSALDDAMDFLRVALAAGPRPAKEVEAEAAAQGIKRKTLRKARERVVRTEKESFSGQWRWSLLDEGAPPLQQDAQPQTRGILGEEGHLGPEELCGGSEQHPQDAHLAQGAPLAGLGTFDSRGASTVAVAGEEGLASDPEQVEAPDDAA